MKNREAIDIDATTYSEKQKTKNKTKKPKKMLQNLGVYEAQRMKEFEGWQALELEKSELIKQFRN